MSKCRTFHIEAVIASERTNGGQAALLSEPVSMGTAVVFCQLDCSTTVRLLGALQVCI